MMGKQYMVSDFGEKIKTPEQISQGYDTLPCYLVCCDSL